jgi:hypothetical protein
MSQTKSWRIAVVAGLGLLVGVAAGRAVEERPPTYVWLFSATGAEVESLSDTVTEEFEEALVKAGCLPIVQRRNLPELQSHQKQEERIEGADSLSPGQRRLLSTASANAVVFGKITDDIQGGQVKIAVTLETLSGAILANTSVRISRGKRLDADERERRMAELASEVCSALGSTKNGFETSGHPPQPPPLQPSAKQTCSTLRDDFNGEQKWWVSTTGGFGIQDSAFKLLVSQTGSGEKRCLHCNVSASRLRVSATAWEGRNAATWGLYILDMSGTRDEWFSLEVEREGRVSIKRYSNYQASILWSGTYRSQGKDRLTLEANEGTLIASINGTELGRATYDPKSVPNVPLGVGFIITTTAEAPAEARFDDYELTFCR